MNPTPKTQIPEPETAETHASEAIQPEDETRAETTAEARTTAGTVADADGIADADADAGVDADADDADDDEADIDAAAAHRSSGLGAAAASIVAVCLGIVALTGTWTSRVVSERENLVGQIKIGQSPTAAQQISEIYGDPWHATAAVNGVVALLALLIGVIVLALPQRAGWVRPAALAGAVLGFLGLLVSIGMYFDLFASLPSVGA
ncbi:hypothetical protein [Streptomyces sp. AK02-01A]|uniref:hypothetical protein n=1 Tax=Streptomyces sp. AK02-01A TaxID=3028648 RepID=UPI0029A8E430|nr:hypothetical protein [Streptomyces sp. AK02-01A]MDX3851887.1 hypothetical protein [Streptomyces sp. AK02-01A]